MYKISHIQQLCDLKDVPNEVIQIVVEAVTILDAEYGADRGTDSGYGGFILVLQSKERSTQFLQQQLTKIHVDIDSVVPEYVESIICSDGQNFSNTLILCGSDFGVVLLLPMEITPSNLKSYLVK